MGDGDFGSAVFGVENAGAATATRRKGGRTDSLGRLLKLGVRQLCQFVAEGWRQCCLWTAAMGRLMGCRYGSWVGI